MTRGLPWTFPGGNAAANKAFVVAATMRSERRTVDVGGGSVVSRHGSSSGDAAAGMVRPSETPSPYAFAAGASHVFKTALAGVYVRLGKPARSLVAIGPPIWAPNNVEINRLRKQKINTRYYVEVVSI